MKNDLENDLVIPGKTWSGTLLGEWGPCNDYFNNRPTIFPYHSTQLIVRIYLNSKYLNFQFQSEIYILKFVFCLFKFLKPSLSLSNRYLTDSVLDQQKKQTLQFNGGQLISNYEGRVFSCSYSAAYRLVPVPWETQVQVN